MFLCTVCFTFLAVLGHGAPSSLLPSERRFVCGKSARICIKKAGSFVSNAFLPTVAHVKTQAIAYRGEKHVPGTQNAGINLKPLFCSQTDFFAIEKAI